jgi:hypothetical protein
MTAVTIFSFLVGTVLGMRFRVFVLGPASLVAIALIAITVRVLGGTYWSALMAMAASLATLQLGFLAGMTFQSAIATYAAPSKRRCRTTEQKRTAHLAHNG